LERQATVKYKALLCTTPHGGRSLISKVIVPLLTVIKAIISSGVLPGNRSILFSSSIKNYLFFHKANKRFKFIQLF